jgi:hypothetical protein
MRIAGGPSPRSRQARMQPTLTVSRSANSWIVSNVPSGCLSSCGFDCFETAVTFADIRDAAIVFLHCGMRLVGIIGYHLTVSLPPQPTSPEIGFTYETRKFRKGFGGFRSTQRKLTT